MRIGDTAHRTRRITREDIGLFAEMTGDRNPLHFDEALAAQSRFGGIVVQGGITSGLLNALVAEDLPGPGSVFLHTDFSFRSPVRPGDVLTAQGRITDLRTDKPISTLDLSIRNQDDVVVLDGTAVVWRDPAVAASVPRAAGPTATAPHLPVRTAESQPPADSQPPAVSEPTPVAKPPAVSITAAPEFAGGGHTHQEEA